MTYTVRTTGRPVMRSIDTMCLSCGYHEERMVDVRGCDDDDAVRKAVFNALGSCPNCEDDMAEVMINAPSVGGGDPKSDKNLERMQQSFRERFVKKEMADVQHKHGTLFGDSIRSKAVQRIKKKEKPT